MPSWANVAAEYATPKVGHPFPGTAGATGQHDAAEGLLGATPTVLLQNNRHATCVDCHNAHGAQQVGAFPPPPLIRISQKDVLGISASDGTSILAPAINQYESCLRCHGTSAGKQSLTGYGYLPVRAVSASDSLNVMAQFTPTDASISNHPVMHTSTSGRPQPSLMQNMANLDGLIVGGNGQGRAMGTQILCTDCHNSDDNREFGGSGPNGPHGSSWHHILERRYEFNTPTTRGGTVENLFPTPNLGVTGPYALCGKCHNLSIVQNPNSNNGSWIYHNNHLNDGFSCSVCHTAHGMGAIGGTISGERLVNFDVSIVAPNGIEAISYNHGTNTCALLCHGHTHLSGSNPAPASFRTGIGIKR
jgi:hypothetical protein